METTIKFLPDTHTTKETAYIVSDYPYGFSLRTTLFIWIEYKKWKGYRVARQTINPKNGKENKPKYSTYSEYYRLYLDENEYVQSYSISYYNIESYEKALQDGLFENLTNPIDHEERMRITVLGSIRWILSFRGFTINGDTSKLKEPPILTDSMKEKIALKTYWSAKEVLKELESLQN